MIPSIVADENAIFGVNLVHGLYTVDNNVAVGINRYNVCGVDFVGSFNAVNRYVTVDYRDYGFGLNLMLGLFAIDYKVAIVADFNGGFLYCVPGVVGRHC